MTLTPAILPINTVYTKTSFIMGLHYLCSPTLNIHVDPSNLNIHKMKPVQP